MADLKKVYKADTEALALTALNDLCDKNIQYPLHLGETTSHSYRCILSTINEQILNFAQKKDTLC